MATPEVAIAPTEVRSDAFCTLAAELLRQGGCSGNTFRGGVSENDLDDSESSLSTCSDGSSQGSNFPKSVAGDIDISDVEISENSWDSEDANVKVSGPSWPSDSHDSVVVAREADQLENNDPNNYSCSSSEQPVDQDQDLQCNALGTAEAGFTPQETLIIFDWDDTLLPSSWIATTNLTLDVLSNPTPEEVELLDATAVVVCQVLRLACSYGRVVVVTNAEAGWVQLSASKFMPTVSFLLEDCGIEVISARTLFEGPMNVTPLSWKLEAFKQTIQWTFPGTAAEYERLERSSMAPIQDMDDEVFEVCVATPNERPAELVSEKFMRTAADDGTRDVVKETDEAVGMPRRISSYNGSEVDGLLAGPCDSGFAMDNEDKISELDEDDKFWLSVTEAAHELNGKAKAQSECGSEFDRSKSFKPNESGKTEQGDSSASLSSMVSTRTARRQAGRKNGCAVQRRRCISASTTCRSSVKDNIVTGSILSSREAPPLHGASLPTDNGADGKFRGNESGILECSTVDGASTSARGGSSGQGCSDIEDVFVDDEVNGDDKETCDGDDGQAFDALAKVAEISIRRNILSFGDSESERLALVETSKDLECARYKSFKFCERPDPIKLRHELILILNSLESVVSYDGILDLKVNWSSPAPSEDDQADSIGGSADCESSIMA